MNQDRKKTKSNDMLVITEKVSMVKNYNMEHFCTKYHHLYLLTPAEYTNNAEQLKFEDGEQMKLDHDALCDMRNISLSWE